jgi:hypothetical protein
MKTEIHILGISGMKVKKLGWTKKLKIKLKLKGKN